MEELITNKIERLKEELEVVNERIVDFEGSEGVVTRHWLKQANSTKIGILHALVVLMQLKAEFLTNKQATLLKDLSTPEEETEAEYHERIHKEKQADRNNYYG